MIDQPGNGSDASDPAVDGQRAVHVRLLRPGEGTAAIAVAAAANSPGNLSGSSLQATLIASADMSPLSTFPVLAAGVSVPFLTIV